MADISNYMGKMGKEYREHNEKMRHIRAEWKPEEWAEMERKLQELSAEELRRVATLAGMEFEDGNESVVDSPHHSAKEQFILVLDEVGKDELLRAYETILHERSKNK